MDAADMTFLPLHTDPPSKAAKMSATHAGEGAAGGRSSGSVTGATSGSAAATVALPLAASSTWSSRGGAGGEKRRTAPPAGSGSDVGLVEVRTALAGLETALTSSRDLSAVTLSLRNLCGALSVHFTSSTLASLTSAFDLSILPALVDILQMYLREQEAVLRARAEGATPPVGSVPDETAFEILCCLVNIGAGDSHMTRLLIKHAIIPLAVRALQVCRDADVVENAIWVLGNVAGDGATARDEVVRHGGYAMILGHAAVELHRLGYWPFDARMGPDGAQLRTARAVRERDTTNPLAGSTNDGTEPPLPAGGDSAGSGGARGFLASAEFRDIGAIYRGAVELMKTIGQDRLRAMLAGRVDDSTLATATAVLQRVVASANDVVAAAEEGPPAAVTMLENADGTLDIDDLPPGAMFVDTDDVFGPPVTPRSGTAPSATPASPTAATMTSAVLKIATWALSNICEQQPHVRLEPTDLLVVLNACLDVPDPEVLSHASWTLSHFCDCPNDCIRASLSSLECVTDPAPAAALASAHTLTPDEFAMRATGTWGVLVYAPPEDVAFSKAALPSRRPEDVAAVQRAHVGYPLLRFSSPTSTGWPRQVPSTASKLVRLLRHESVRVSKPALRAVGNIVCAEDEADFTQAVVDLGTVPYLRALLDHSAREVQKEACWTMSNIAAGTAAQIQAVLDSGCLGRAMAMCCDSACDVGVRTESCWILLNAAACGNDRQVEVLVRSGTIRALCALMSDPSMVMMAIDGLEKILQVCERLSSTAASLMVSKGRVPAPAIAPASMPLPLLSAPAVTTHGVASGKGGGKGSSSGKGGGKKAAAAALAATAVAPTAGSPVPRTPAFLALTDLYGPDVPLEDVLLSEAKTLLDTCRSELLTNQGSSSGATPTASHSGGSTNSGGGTGPIGAPSSITAGTARHESIYKRAAKLWANHFVTCELCHRTYSKSSQATHFCDECRCNVCFACNCQVYHMSFQLAALLAEEEEAAAAAAAAGSKGKGKKAKKAAAAAASAPAVPAEPAPAAPAAASAVSATLDARLDTATVEAVPPGAKGKRGHRSSTATPGTAADVTSDAATREFVEDDAVQGEWQPVGKASAMISVGPQPVLDRRNGKQAPRIKAATTTSSPTVVAVTSSAGANGAAATIAGMSNSTKAQAVAQRVAASTPVPPKPATAVASAWGGAAGRRPPGSVIDAAPADTPAEPTVTVAGKGSGSAPRKRPGAGVSAAATRDVDSAEPAGEVLLPATSGASSTEAGGHGKRSWRSIVAPSVGATAAAGGSAVAAVDARVGAVDTASHDSFTDASRTLFTVPTAWDAPRSGAAWDGRHPPEAPPGIATGTSSKLSAPPGLSLPPRGTLPGHVSSMHASAPVFVPAEQQHQQGSTSAWPLSATPPFSPMVASSSVMQQLPFGMTAAAGAAAAGTLGPSPAAFLQLLALMQASNAAATPGMSSSMSNSMAAAAAASANLSALLAPPPASQSVYFNTAGLPGGMLAPSIHTPILGAVPAPPPPGTPVMSSILLPGVHVPSVSGGGSISSAAAGGTSSWSALQGHSGSAAVDRLSLLPPALLSDPQVASVPSMTMDSMLLPGAHALSGAAADADTSQPLGSNDTIDETNHRFLLELLE